LHTAEKYINGVITGKIPACKSVIDCYKRHRRDLKNCKKNGWVFNPNYSQRVINLFSTMVHYDGVYQGRPFILEPWQQAIIWVLFGWRLGSAHGPRRFRTCYIEIPKKNGKTPLGAGFLIYLAFFDDKTGVNVYSAATKRDQAKICLNDAKNYILNSPPLKNHFKISNNAILNPPAMSGIQALAKDSNTADGIKVSGAVIDEVHRHKDSEMIDLLNSSSASNEMLLIEITTAGTDRQSVCYKHHQYTERVNRGQVSDDHWFGLIYSLDKNDDWTDEKNWYKANPNLGTGKDLTDFRRKVKAAINDPTKENAVKRYEFNIWTGSTDKWIAENVWTAAQKNRDDSELTDPAVEVYAGLDLASSRDFNALALLFVNRVAGWKYLKTWFWCPAEKVDDRVERQNIDFHQWVNNGYLNQVPGNVVASEDRENDIIEICHRYGVASVAYDKYNAIDTVNAMVNAGIECHEQPQTIMFMSQPTKKIAAEIVSGKLNHDGNPVLTWMMDNVLIYTDANGNIKIHKGKSQDKVDGPVAAVMAYAEYFKTTYQDDNQVYDYRGLTVIPQK
jgi:phage terminase large subunit-like protein